MFSQTFVCYFHCFARLHIRGTYTSAGFISFYRITLLWADVARHRLEHLATVMGRSLAALLPSFCTCSHRNSAWTSSSSSVHSPCGDSGKKWLSVTVSDLEMEKVSSVETSNPHAWLALYVGHIPAILPFLHPTHWTLGYWFPLEF